MSLPDEMPLQDPNQCEIVKYVQSLHASEEEPIKRLTMKKIKFL